MENNQKVITKDRKDQFRAFSLKRSNHEVLISPILLPTEERRLHIRQTLLEDHQYRIINNPEGAKAKFAKLADSPFYFYRGTALLFYRDYAGIDNEYPIVYTNGDIHPENFGVMPNANGEPFFGVNDFDEAAFAPFTYDLKKGAVGFYIAAKEAGFKKKKRKKILKKFALGYVRGLEAFVESNKEKWYQYKIDNSPTVIQKLLKSANRDRKSFLSKKIDLSQEMFIKTKKVIPITDQVNKFQAVIDQYVNGNDIKVGQENTDFYKVKDVAIKKGSGTASLGLNRYFVLVNGPSEKPEDNVILELKQARRSALYSMIPDEYRKNGAAAEHIVMAHQIHLAAGDPFYGTAFLDDQEFIVRERSPYKEEIDVDDLDFQEFKEYARVCGEVIAQTHARSDQDVGLEQSDKETEILSSIHPDTFIYDIARFGKVAGKRVYRDYKLFKKDYDIGFYEEVI